MTIEKLEKKVYPLKEISKINEIIDGMNLTGVFATTNESALVPSSGICTWTVVHNLNTTNVVCLLLINNAEISKNVTINNANSVTISFNSIETKEAGVCKVVVMTRGGLTGSDGSGVVNNSTISIIQGDVPKGSFTLNQAQDQTIDLVAGGSYNLPTASTTKLGGVKIDDKTIKIDNEVISAGVYPKAYFVSGVIVKAKTNATVSGFGSANITLYGSGLAEIKFTFKITAKDSTVDWIWGLNRDLMKNLNSQLPIITPMNHVGALLFYNNYKISDSWNGYGGLMEVDASDTAYWIPARLYTTSGTIGRYSASSLNTDTRIEGTAYGTYQVGTEG